MPMRVGDTPDGGAPGAGDNPGGAPAPGAPPGAPAAEDPEAAKKKKTDTGLGEDAVDAAGWGCAIFECFDCLSVLAVGAVTTAVVVRRTRRRRRAASAL